MTVNAGHASRFLASFLGALLLTLSCAALADPPDHAKAHGWRKKNDPRYVGYTGREWDRDYGIVGGSCNRKEIGTVIGAVAGGAIGSQIGDGDSRPVAIIVGAVLGAVIGREIGEDMDDADRGCFGHALELVEPGKSVRWLNERTHVTYLLTPLAGSGRDSSNCRPFRLKMQREGQSRSTDGRACRTADGTWKMIQG
jgi:surface antigen